MTEEKRLESLKSFLNEGRNWERRPTSVPGVFIMKLPTYGKSTSKLVVEINPVDSYGNPTKKRGLLIRSMHDVKSYQDLLAHGKLGDLLNVLKELNPPVVERGDSKSEVIEL
jgi:hypothetical protein